MHKACAQNFSRPRPLQLPARVQWHSISMLRHNFTACNSKSLSRNRPVQLFISISCSIVSEKLANRGIVWLSNGKGGGLPGNMEAPPAYAPGMYKLLLTFCIVQWSSAAYFPALAAVPDQWTCLMFHQHRITPVPYLCEND